MLLADQAYLASPLGKVESRCHFVADSVDPFLALVLLSLLLLLVSQFISDTALFRCLNPDVIPKEFDVLYHWLCYSGWAGDTERIGEVLKL